MSYEISPFGFPRSRATPAQIRRLKKGGKLADRIRDARELHHKTSEDPRAELFLKSSESVWKSAKAMISPLPHRQEKMRQSFWKRILDFFEGSK